MHLELNNEKWNRLAAPKKYPIPPIRSKSQTKPKRGIGKLESQISERLNMLAKPKNKLSRPIELLVPIKKQPKPKFEAKIITDNIPKGILKYTGEPVCVSKTSSMGNQRRQIWLDLMAKPKTINIDTNPDYERIVNRKPNKHRISELAKPKYCRCTCNRNVSSPSLSI